jgi:glycosyltransferase-like protein
VVLSIGMLTYSTKPRGSVVHAASVSDALARDGHRVTLYALAAPGAKLYRDVSCRVVLFDARDPPADRDALVRQRISEFVAGLEATATRHDLLHAQDCLAASALLESRAHRGLPLVRTVHHVERFESRYLTDCQRRSVEVADEVFSVSRITQREVAAEFGRSSRLVPNGVDAARFEGPRPARSWVEERFGIPAGAPLVLSVGGVEPRKNSRVALAAFSMAAASHPNLSWLIAGGSSLWDHSRYADGFEADLSQAPEDLRRRVVRAGPLREHELTALYRLADVLLFPSLREGFGLCVLEAMAAGMPVIVPREEPFTEYLDDRSAVFVDPRCAPEIARAISELIDDSARRLSLARAARDQAVFFPWSRSSSLHAAHYDALLSRDTARIRSHA